MTAETTTLPLPNPESATSGLTPYADTAHTLATASIAEYPARLYRSPGAAGHLARGHGGAAERSRPG